MLMMLFTGCGELSNAGESDNGKLKEDIDFVEDNDNAKEDDDILTDSVDYISANKKSETVYRNGEIDSYTEYDKEGRITYRETSQSIVEHTYDGAKETVYVVVSDKMLEINPNIQMKEYTEEIVFDNNGNIIQHCKYDEEMSLYYSCEYNYDSKDNLLMKYENDMINNRIDHVEYEYDDNGNEIKTIIYNDDDSINRIIDNQYNDENRIISSLTSLSSGRKMVERLYEYEEGRLIKERDIYYNDTVPNEDDMYSEDYFEFEYDEQGNIIGEKCWRENTEFAITEYKYCNYDNIYEYTYDGNNTIVTKKTLEVDDQKKPLQNYYVGSISIIDEKGRVISYSGDSIDIPQITYDSLKIQSSDTRKTIEIEYNDKDEIMNYTISEDGEITSTLSREYNIQGDCIREEIINPSYTDIYIREYEYY